MISLKDYAAQRNITYEAVRKSVTRYKDELEGHITIVDRTQYLDDEAVAFLDEKRKKNPVVIIQQDKDARIEELEKEVDQLKSKVIMLYERIDQKDEVISRLSAANQEQISAPEPECQDELVIDAEPGDPEQEQTEPQPKPGFAERFKMAWKILKGE